MASAASREELVTKVQGFVNAHHGGDYKAAFDAHDFDKDGKINTAELIGILALSGVGWKATRPVWADKVINDLDTNGDGKIGWAEFEAVLKPKA